MEMRPGKMQAVRAMVPLGEMFGYATDLRSATQAEACSPWNLTIMLVSLKMWHERLYPADNRQQTGAGLDDYLLL